jgi:hypothetical protein
LVISHVLGTRLTSGMTTPSHAEPPPDTVCPCGHAIDEHDLIASRYCKATAAGALTRACMCVPASVSLPR